MSGVQTPERFGGEPEHDETPALEAPPGTAPVEDLAADRLHRAQAEALGWSTGRVEREELPPLEADDQTPEQLSLLNL
ncbi:hypothetical protein ACFOOM_01065 [Streptomyces echinoruber]|uniref:Uncharacterized protein n=1 Tax=Streptomyces echinoruber TaxID=68898 RepID=A0A918QVY5_9ACTN|nr:hypothetical protein [Streptomyces echinoruber]GGZ73108.1 hypothetical protein GCM10010389_08210 [Streptomyces echinoruber]